MNIKSRIKTAMVTAALLCTLCISTAAAGDKQEVKVLFTHDLHSHLDEYKVQKKGSDSTSVSDGGTHEEWVGGFARMKTLIDEKRSENPATFLLDGGDFSMGTLYQTIYESHAAELTMLGKLGYDATTFGNHEFDYRSGGVAHMLRSAVENAEKDDTLKLPAFVTANIDWEKNTSAENKMVKEALSDYGSTPYAIIEHGGVRVGVYGVLGEDADLCAPESDLTFDSIVDTSKRVVKQLKKEDVDMIVCLSHSGTNKDKEKSEDEILAQEVPDIDVIVSGHTHTTLDEYIQVGNTYIVSAGCYGKKLGELNLTRDESGRWEMKEYKLNALKQSVPKNEEILLDLASYKKAVDAEYLKQFDYTFDQVLAANEVKFTQMDDFAEKHEEDPLGSVIADAYVYAVQQAEGEAYEKVYVAVSPSGAIRDSFQKGELTVSDAFNVSSLGIGADRIPGYPLVSVYLTGGELKTAAEIDVSVSPLMTTAQLYPSGVRWSYNPSRMILNRVTDVEFVTNIPYTANKETQEIEDDRLYRVVAGLYSAQMLGTVEDMSKGLLKLSPKDKDGNTIDNFEDYIIHDQNGAELKEWYALATYLESFEKNAQGISEVPAYYEKAEGRKKEENSKNIVSLLNHPNKFALILYGAVLFIILLIVLVAAVVIKRRKKKKNVLY